MAGPNLSPQTPNVLVVMETSFEFGRQVIRGVGDYCRINMPWNFEIYAVRQGANYLKPLCTPIHGIIGRIPTPGFARQLRRLGVPIVCLASGVAGIEIDVGTSQAALCQLAVDHFTDRAFKNVAFFGRYSTHGQSRWQCFKSLATARGLSFRGAPSLGRWNLERLAIWLKTLPIPTGLLCSDDVAAMHVINAARLAGIIVPEQLAVLGIDNDALICDITNPRLSSVALNPQRIGFEAANQLAQLMSGGVKARHIEVPPVGVVQRGSTDALATEDRDVREAVTYIRDNAVKGISVAAVVAHVGISRRSLEMRFRASLKKAIHDEIRRVQLDQAKHLLARSDLKIEMVARRSGFANGPYMHRVFKQDLMQTPLEYRRQIGWHPDGPDA